MGSWDPRLHPRGPDGRFGETTGPGLSKMMDDAIRRASGRLPDSSRELPLHAEAADRIKDLVSNVDPSEPHGAAMARTQAAIDRVHRMPDGMRPIPLGIEDRPGYLGAYRGNRIDLNPNGRYPHITAAHELGHFLDRAGLPPARAFTVETQLGSGENFNEWWKAVQSSRTTQVLQSIKSLPDGSILVRRRRPDGIVNELDVDHAHVDYLLSPREMFGRSYAQWIATQSGDPGMLADLELAQDPANGEQVIPGTGFADGYPGYWNADDFEPIASALSEAFRRLGLLR